MENDENSKTNRLALHTVLNHMENPNKNDLFEGIKEFMIVSDKYMKLKDKLLQIISSSTTIPSLWT